MLAYGQQILLPFLGSAPPPLVPVAVPSPVSQPRPLPTDQLLFTRSVRSSSYRLTLRRDGTAVVTIPRRGSEREARRFAEENRAWLERARLRQACRPRVADLWTVGTHVLWRGQMTEIRVASTMDPFGLPGEPARPKVCLASDVFRVRDLEGDLRPTLEAHFARRAKVELPARTWELAAVTG
ncbi:MAG: DUF45 domain-containing protein, partial [Opitutaceae bacterium]|nr:DUF45 domain-containing protein [Opitutaceae bacterium]